MTVSDLDCRWLQYRCSAFCKTKKIVLVFVQLLREEPPKKVLKSDTAAEDLPEDSQEVATECQSDTDSQKTSK